MLFVSTMISKNRHQNEIRLRNRLENALGRFDETSWEIMLEDGVVQDHLDGRDDMDWNELRGYGERVLKRQRKYEREHWERWKPPEELREESSESASATVTGVRSQPVFDVELPKREKKRAVVLLEIQMRRAADHPDVNRIRQARFGGRLLSADEAEAYFTSGSRGGIADEELDDLARRLGKTYGWHHHDAAWFVLTAELSTLRPLDVSFFDHRSVYGPSYGEITLHVAPWIPASEVKKVFLEAKSQMRGDAGPGAVSEQRLEVLRFVEEENAKSGHQPALSALFEIWNQKYPSFAYADYRSFSKAYREARKEVLYPEYCLPRRESTPNMERQEARHRKWIEAVRKRDANRPPPKSLGNTPVRWLE